MTTARGDDASTIAAINKASAQLDDAFVHGNAKAIRRAMTSDHLEQDELALNRTGIPESAGI
jgi:hypothetical protein